MEPVSSYQGVELLFFKSSGAASRALRHTRHVRMKFWGKIFNDERVVLNKVVRNICDAVRQCGITMLVKGSVLAQWAVLLHVLLAHSK